MIERVPDDEGRGPGPRTPRSGAASALALARANPVPVLLALGAAIFLATRLLTLARDPWEWDEVLFTAAAREGPDVRVNHPHPPGYPVYVLLSRVLVLAGASPFFAATAIAVLGGLLAVPALAALARELCGRRDAAVWGALAWALTPSVWLHSVRPLSDAPSAASFFLASVVLLRTIREPSHRRLLWSALAAAACFGIRPQVGVALIPAALWAAWRVVRREGGPVRVLLTGVAGGIAAVIPYLFVIAGSGGLHAYLAAFAAQAEYVRRVDVPGLDGLLGLRLWRRWLLDPFGVPWAGAALWTVAIAGTAVSSRAVLRALALFVPLAALSIPMLGAHTAPRYALTLVALPCLAAACAAAEALRRWPRSTAVLASGLLAVVALPGVPAVVEVSARTSPPTAAIAALGTGAFSGRPVLVDPALHVHAEEKLGSGFGETDPYRPVPLGRGGLVLAVDRVPFGLSPLQVFRFQDPLLPTISRGRYLEVGIYDGAGVGALTWKVSGEGSRADSLGRVRLAPGGSLQVTSRASAVRVRARTSAGAGGARIDVVGMPGTEHAVIAPGEGSIDVVASGAFRVRVSEGSLVLARIRVEAAEPQRGAASVEDPGLPVAVDEPAEGSEVGRPLVVRGWGRLPGGPTVEPTEFWIDGERVVPVRVERTARPDVAAVLPNVGDVSAAGWRAVFEDEAVEDGEHVLVVVFSAGERRRAYPARRFTIRGSSSGSGGPSPRR